jgi:hypothetical protein
VTGKRYFMFILYARAACRQQAKHNSSFAAKSFFTRTAQENTRKYRIQLAHACDVAKRINSNQIG